LVVRGSGGYKEPWLPHLGLKKVIFMKKWGNSEENMGWPLFKENFSKKNLAAPPLD